MITMNDLYVGYDSTPVVHGVSLTIQPSRVNVLLGPNGSGKTTILKTILGIIKPLKGYVRVKDLDPTVNPIEARKLIGYVPEEDLIYYSLRVKEYLSFIARVYNVPRDRLVKTMDRVMEAFMIKDYADALIGELSHGLKRRVMLASAFIHDPEILILDEPFIGIDPRVAKVLKLALREKAKEGKTILVTTHILEIAEALADNIILLYKGKVVAEGSVNEILSRAKAGGLEDAFLTLTMSRELVQELVKALISV